VERTEVRERFLAQLVAAGVDVDAPSTQDVSTAWKTMRVFAAQTVEGSQRLGEAGDWVPVHFGEPGWHAHYSNTRRGEFQLDITRQFIWHKHFEHQAMSRLKCSVYFASRQELGAVGGAVMWSFDRPEEDFFEATLASDGFSIVSDLELRPTRVGIEHSDLWSVSRLGNDRWEWSAWTGSKNFGPRFGTEAMEAEAREAICAAVKAISDADMAARMRPKRRRRFRLPG
jgi:hypothetical protein